MIPSFMMVTVRTISKTEENILYYPLSTVNYV